MIYTQNENTIPFFLISLAFMKLEISATFFSDKVEFFRICPRYYSSQFSQVIVLFHFSRKSQDKKFLEFFQRFAAFNEIEKCRLFFAFLRLACLIDSCQEKARNSNQCSCSFNIIAPFISTNILWLKFMPNKMWAYLAHAISNDGVYLHIVHFGYAMFGTEWAHVSFREASSYFRKVLLT